MSKTKTKLKWRLTKLPTADELLKLVDAKVITVEEAKDILFSVEDDGSKKSLEEEIIFLRELVTKLSNNKPSLIIETIRSVEVAPYVLSPWFKPYVTWCSAGDPINYGSVGNSGTGYVDNGGNCELNGNIHLCSSGGNNLTAADIDFNAIRTF